MRVTHRTIAATLAVLASPTVLLAAQEEHGEGGGGLFSINLGLSVWTIVVFVALLLVLRKWAWGPILAALDTRERGIRETLDEAARLREEAAGLLEEHRRQVAEARRQAQEIVAESRQAAEQVRRELEVKARQEGEAILDGARRDIQLEKERAIHDLRRQSVELAMAAAGRLLRRKLDAETDRELISEYLDELQEGEEAKA